MWSFLLWYPLDREKQSQRRVYMDSYVTGTAIRQLREAKHLTQAELAEKLAELVPTLL